MTASMMDELLEAVPDGRVLDIRVGAFWTAMVVEAEGRLRCGLASNLRCGEHCHGGEASVQDPGSLMQQGLKKLSGLARSGSLMEASIGMAAVNASLSLPEEKFVELNAEELIGRLGVDRRVTLVGDFPFIPRLGPRVMKLNVLEQHPRGGHLPAKAASDVIPESDVVAITGTAFINHTFDELMALCRPEAIVLVLGPSTPLSPVLFDRGVDYLCGSVVENADAVLAAVSQGANFRQIHRVGVRLVSLKKEDFP
jgi:uncharacterized protein (DUF4213/DUF364 family)